MSYPPFPFPFLAWFAFVPLFLGWRRGTTSRRAYLDAYGALLVTFAVAFHWPLMHEMPATALLSLPPLLVIPMWLALPFGLARFVDRRLGTAAASITLITLMILAEFGLRAGPLAFPWTLVGHTQAEVLPVNRLAAYGGVPLLSASVLLVNVVIFAAVRRRSVFAAVRRRCVFAILVALSVFAIAAILTLDPDRTLGSQVPAHNRPSAGAVRIAGIQPALSPLEWANVADSSRVTMLLDLSRRAVVADSSVDLIVWPETAIPPHPATGAYATHPYLDRLRHFADSTGIPILAGAITTTDDRASIYRNSAVLAVHDGPVRTYDKINLVPFAERVPFTGTDSFLERLAIPAGGVAGYEPGENRTIFEIPGLRFGVLICFETLFGGAARSYVRDGAELLVAITQDGWWGDSFGYRQHLAFNRLRSIETGLPLVQSAVTGLSALIHPDGRVQKTAGWMERAIWTVDIPTPTAPPLSVRWGDWVTMLAAFLAAAATTAYAINRGFQRHKRRPMNAT